MCQIGLEELLDRPRRIFGLEIVIDLLPDIGIGTKTAAAGMADDGALSNSSASAFSIRAVSLPPGTQRFRRASPLPAIASE